MSTKVVPLSMEDILVESQKLVNKYRHKHLDYIFGVTTGGIIPGFLVADLLKKDYLYANLRPTKEKTNIKGKPTILIIDDIEDTGKTKKIVMKMFPKTAKIYFETLFKAEKNTWISFPWELQCQNEINSRQTKI